MTPTYAEMLAGLRATGHGFEIRRVRYGPERGSFRIYDYRIATLEPCAHRLPSPPPHPPVGSFTHCWYCHCSRFVGSKS